jgi:hypothetical protein
MPGMRKVSIAAVLAAATTFAGGARADDCKLTQVASLDAVWTAAGDLAVKVAIDGKSELLSLDMVSPKSSLTKSAVDALGLEHTALNPTWRITLDTGEVLNTGAMAKQFMIGNLAVSPMKFIVVPDNTLAGGIAGSLATDILTHYDVEIDAAHGKVNLFAQDHCPGQVVYWTRAPSAVIAMRITSWFQTVFSVELDGHVIDATLDPAAARSHIAYDLAAAEFGWGNGPGAPVPSDGMAGESGDYSPVFKHLSLNGVDITNPRIVVQKEGAHWAQKIPLAVGMNILRKFHLFVSYSDHAIYLTSADAPPSDQTQPPQAMAH